MTKWDDGDKWLKHCRWCGKAYKAHKPVGRDGFCCNAHKMAHARAYKKYVTRKKISDQLEDPAGIFKVTKRGGEK